MRIKNITPSTVSIDVWGRHIEMRSGWGVSEREVFGGKDTLLFIAFKLQGQIEIYDDNDQIMEFIHCPLCGNVVKVAPAPKVIPTIPIAQVVIKGKIEQPVKAEVKDIKVKKSRVKNKK